MDRNTQTERYTVEVRLPGRGPPIPIIIPFPPTSTVSEFADEITRRTRRSDPNAIILALHLGENGPLLGWDDLLYQVLLHPQQERVFAVLKVGSNEEETSGADFTITASAINPFVNPGRRSSSKNGGLLSAKKPVTTNNLRIRVITPYTARENADINAIPLLFDGRHISGGMTLRELRGHIADIFQWPLGIEPQQPSSQECNCAFARRISERGIWDKLDCHNYKSEGPTHQCKFGSHGGLVPMTKECAICSRSLETHDRITGVTPLVCSTSVFMRTDGLCQHLIHGHCLASGATWTCPRSCLSARSSAPSTGTIPTPSDIPNKTIIVHGRSEVEFIHTAASDRASLIAAVRKGLGDDVEKEKAITLIGGVNAASSALFVRLPVIALCCRKRHGSDSDSDLSADTEMSSDENTPERGTRPSPEPRQQGRQDTGIDLHTSEGPIETMNLDISLDQAGLRDCAVKGILNIYAVQRSRSSPTQHVDKGSGKEAIFRTDSFWVPPIIQSDRGMALFLSSLRLFTDLINAKEMDQLTQDSLLRVFHQLTQFPPALRAVHVLMNGKTPRPPECAALVQSVYAVLEDIVPNGLLNDRKDRMLEGSRLLFGFLLERANELKLDDESVLPYLSSFETIDLKDAETLEPTVRPVLTNIGLVEEGYYKAHKEGGILAWTSGEQPLEAGDLERQTKRIALLCGGTIREITVFNSDALHTIAQSKINKRMDEKVIKSIIQDGFPDLTYLSSFCERNGLAVLPPMKIRSSNPGVLTLDRDGLVAVYVGRPPCAAPPKDITIFRPTKGGDENVDVAIITQVIAPILQEREEDGSSVFDLFSGGSGRSKSVDPEEVIIFCVDCSRSMLESCDFLDIKEENSQMDTENEQQVQVMEGPMAQSSEIESGTYIESTLEEMKEMITKHESFEDMLNLLYGISVSKRRAVAEAILEFVSVLLSRHLSDYLKTLESLREWATMRYRQIESKKYDSRIAKLKSQISGLSTHKEALCDLLIFRSVQASNMGQKWMWRVGEDIPRWKHSRTLVKDMESRFELPHDYMCPIGISVFEDPVTASDGFTYERSSIERWFRIRWSSPSTGLPIQNTTVKANVVLARKVKEWVEAADIISLAATTEKKRRRSFLRPRGSQGREIQFFSQMGSFTRKLPPSLSMADLYVVAFRGMKGVSTQFDLRYNGTVITPSSDTILSLDIADDSLIHINLHDNKRTSSDDKKDEDGNNKEPIGCLIKVYDNHEKEAFSYWTTKDTTDSVASIIFRYWRFLRSKPFWNRSVNNLDIMTGVKDHGDGYLTGVHQNHWNPLSSLFTKEIANGRLTAETTYNEADPDPPDSKDALETKPSSSAEQPEEKPLVLKAFVRTRRSNKKKQSAAQLTRILSRHDVMKQIFDSFVNRILAYDYPTHIGLITFGSTATIAGAPTHIIENFRDSVHRMKANGDTALWDALALADDQLTQYTLKYPNAKKRIICLSDGEDTKSSRTKEDICRSLEQNNVVVDSFCLGDAESTCLRTVSYLTGGYKFTPKTLEQAMSICEMEPVLNYLERPPLSRPRKSSARQDFSLAYQWSFLTAGGSATPDIVTRDVYPERKQHPELTDTFVQLSAIAQTMRNPKPTRVSAESSSRPSNFNLRWSRLLSEIKTILNNPHPYYDVYVSESNIGFWKVVMQGPPETAFEEGSFLLYLDMDAGYPSSPPKARFVTRIFHPNINRHGRVCHSILDRNWTLDTTNLMVLNTIYGLLNVPEFSDPINTIVTFEFHWDEVAFQEEVREHVRKWAVRADGTGREGWRKEILGE